MLKTVFIDVEMRFDDHESIDSRISSCLQTRHDSHELEVDRTAVSHIRTQIWPSPTYM